jgi:hypothetical protein
MPEHFLGFFSERNIEVIVVLSSEQNSLPFPRYDVMLSKDDRRTIFTILGDPESGRSMTPEEACRALNIRISLYEDGVYFSPSADSLNRETATRLRELLGHKSYLDFLDLESGRQALTLQKMELDILKGTRQGQHQCSESLPAELAASKP